LVTGKIHENSDIDIGIKGLPKGKFFETCAKVYFAMDNDIVDFDNNADFYTLLNRLGEIVEIGQQHKHSIHFIINMENN